MKKSWKRTWKIFGVFLTISNVRVKKRQLRDCQSHHPIFNEKKRLYRLNDGRCMECGKPFVMEDMQIHHVFSYHRFPELNYVNDNMMLVCRSCHFEIHTNPFVNARIQKQKAEAMGIDINTIYGKEASHDND